MSVTERISRRFKDGSRARREYIIEVASSEDDARDQLIAAVSSTLDGFALLERECSAEEISDANGIFYGTAVWGASTGFEFQPPDSFELSFDIAAESVHITHSLETIAAYPGGAPNFNQAINVTQDHDVEGADILIPHLGYQFTLTIDTSGMTQAYVLTLADVCGTVNDATFHGFAAGELLLVRISGQRRSDGHWNITFGYLVSRNKTGITIGTITGISKDGWDLLWVKYTRAPDGSNPVLVSKPQYVYIERVYYRADHTDIFP